MIAGVSTEFNPPGPEDFNLPPIFSGVEWFTKPVLVAALSVVVIVWFFWGASRKAAVVPSKLQFAGELGYNFVRNSIARDAIGSQEHMKYVPYLCGLFFFILLNNVAASVPLIQFPTFSHVGWAYVAAAMSWVVYNAVGIKKHGVLGYFKHQTMPAGVPGWLMPLMIPIEFISNILVRPISLSLRLFANMFAGHILLLVFVLGGEYMLLHSGSIALGGVGILTLLMGLAIAGLELFVQCIQAYIFVVLTAQYIGSAIADDH
ncbi:ATP synthase F0, A subunit [Kribbella flavida DSM 17836]|uniref:ATP synthase subunit a n=1 Tax=Kribbella flavida (strain DSM 17836 / JCM 10339 / NBRC 14399) TaxID=479435 RepID=D2Q3E5_KRIFD|nr:F0F1 ATP synthase subunit A [Kribbella flavida]ADB34068.1 ATP synthase F0, A subunit [Kribbella flavida DSM 17836]